MAVVTHSHGPDHHAGSSLDVEGTPLPSASEFPDRVRTPAPDQTVAGVGASGGVRTVRTLVHGFWMIGRSV